MASSDSVRVFLLSEQLREEVPGGIGTHTSALLTSIQALRSDFPSLELHIAATRPKGPDPLEQFEIPIHYIPYGHDLFVRLCDLRIPLFRGGSGIYHSFSMLIPPVSRSQKLVCTVHDLAFTSSPDSFTRHGVVWHSRQLKRISRGAFPVVAVSPQTGENLVAAGISRNRISVIESGADHLGEGDDERCLELLNSRGVSERFILSVSTLEPRKNLARLIEAHSVVRNSIADAPELVIVGADGWGAKARGGEDVHFLGHVPEPILVSLYRSALLLAYVPFEEGFGLPVVEAMANGLPVVSSSVPSAGGATELVDPREVDSIASGIVRLVGDQGRRQTLAAEGFKRVEELSWRKSAHKHMELWESMR